MTITLAGAVELAISRSGLDDDKRITASRGQVRRATGDELQLRRATV